MADAVVAELEPVRARTLELLDDPAELDRLLAVGADRAESIAEETLARVYDRIGFVPRVARLTVLPVTLESARVRLDVPDPRGHRAITEACQDPEIVRWTTIPTPYRAQDAHAFVDALVGPGWASDREYTWAIRRPGSTWLEA